jgi:hypothetical protein
VRRFALSGLVALAAIAGITVPAAAGTASAAVTPSVTRSVTPSVPSAGPAGSGATGYKISCGTAKSCLAVGEKVNNTTGAMTPVALVWSGTNWRSIVVHAPKGTTFDGMTAVSCKSATYCLVIGSDLSGSGIGRPFALIWNGTAVSAAALPPVPSGATDTSLVGATCVAVKSCIAAGTSQNNSGATKLVFDTWNGTKWVLHAQSAATSTAVVEASSVSCVSLSYCVVGGLVDSISGTSISMRPYLGSWNGKTVTAMKVPVPSGFKTPVLLGVSCATTSSCAATGINIGSGNTPNVGAFTETWNGKAWTAAKLPWLAANQISILEDVSCTYSKTAGTRCIAVGAAGTNNAAGPVAESWNGKAWSKLTVPGVGSGKVGVFEGVSCLSAKQCTAIGEVGPATAASGSPMAGLWNGSAWKLMAA